MPAVQDWALARRRLLSLSPLDSNNPTDRAQAPAGHIFQLTDELTQVEFGKTLGLQNFISVEKENRKVGETCRWKITVLQVPERDHIWGTKSMVY